MTDDGELRFTLINARAGHMLPSGDPERYLDVRATLLDGSGGTVSSQRWRIGQTWVWSPVAEKTGDNRLNVGERRELSWTPGTLGASVRLSPENLDYHLKLLESGHPGPPIEALKSYPTRRTLFDRSVATR